MGQWARGVRVVAPRLQIDTVARANERCRGPTTPDRTMPSRFGRLVAVVGALLLLVTCTDDHNPTSFSSFTAPPAPLAALTASPLAVPLIGAGNIARCDRTTDEATALLIAAYPNPTPFTPPATIHRHTTLPN